MKHDDVMKYSVGSFKYTALAWSCIIIFVTAAIWSWLEGEGVIISLGFLFFSALGLLMLSIALHMKIDEEGISVFSLFSEFRMLWNEIESVEIGDWVCVLHGKENKRLVVPVEWSGKQASDALKILDEKINLFTIDEKIGVFADYKFHKNVRVKNA